MTSEFGQRECFVYIMLPGATSFVTAGRFVLDPTTLGGSLGRFVYGQSYLARKDAVAIDPVELKLGRGTFRTTALKGLFGALRDAGPDYWGRRVIEKHAGVDQLGELDYLLYAPHDRAGALSFGLNQVPPAPKRQFHKTLALETLQGLADRIVADEQILDDPETEQIRELMLAGTSMGGARPKAVVEDDDGLWIAKFGRLDDNWNHARIEHAMLNLARDCGLQTAENRHMMIGGRDVLLVKRFDRQKTDNGYLRARMISALTLLYAEDTHHHRDRWSYVLLAENLRRASSDPHKDARELFRRMCFNALISNTDDHPRNHAVIAMGHSWSLSPAYDLIPATPISLERRDLAMQCGDFGRHANASNLLSQSARFNLETSEATTLIDEMEQCVRSTWHEVARRSGVSEQDCEKINSVFAYPGFRLNREAIVP